MAWLRTILRTASWNSGAVAASSATVLIGFAAVGVVVMGQYPRGPSSDDGIGGEGFEIGYELGVVRRQHCRNGGTQVAAAIDEAGGRAGLGEQEDLLAADAEELAGDGGGLGPAEPGDELGDGVGGDGEGALLVGFLRRVGRADALGDPGRGERCYGVAGDLAALQVEGDDTGEA